MFSSLDGLRHSTSCGPSCVISSNVNRQIEEQRPNTSFSETDGQQKLSKSPQPHSKGSHKINFAVDPAVLEFVSSSRHNEELTKLTNERQLKFTWKQCSS